MALEMAVAYQAAPVVATQAASAMAAFVIYSLFIVYLYGHSSC